MAVILSARSRIAAAAAALVLGAAPALADETWVVHSGDGQIVWESEAAEVAIFSFPWQGGRAMLYIEGLVQNMDSRAMQTGYWIGSGEGVCSARLEGPDGRGSRNWGMAEILWDNNTFPSGFTALLDDCGWGYQEMLRAETAAR